MEPIDLRERPPRGPRERLDGLCMLPRTIDKMRASLPGGHLGAYKIDGLSVRLLNTIKVDREALQAVVATARSDEDVAQWLRANADVSRYEEANSILSKRSVEDISPDFRPTFDTLYPHYRDLPSRNLFDIIEADDQELRSRSDRPQS